jgi:hypothetical protein
MAGAGIQSTAAFRAKMCTAKCHGLQTVTRFVAFRGQFMSGAGLSVAFLGQIVPLSWHSAGCHRYKMPARLVAFHGQFESKA